MAIPICKNCKYFRPDKFSKVDKIQYGFCRHPKTQNVNNVTGVITYPKAEDMRKDKANEPLCGSTGFLYEPEVDVISKISKMIGKNEIAGGGLLALVTFILVRGQQTGMTPVEVALIFVVSTFYYVLAWYLVL